MDITKIPVEILWLILHKISHRTGAGVCRQFRDVYRKFFIIKKISDINMVRASEYYTFAPELLIQACRLGLTEYFLAHHQELPDPSGAFLMAAKTGQTVVFQFLLPRFYEKTAHNKTTMARALDRASAKNHPDIVELLLRNSNINITPEPHTLNKPSGKGYFDVVKLLFRFKYWPHMECELAFFKACKNGHENIAKLIMQNVQTRISITSQALIRVCAIGHLNVVQMLLQIRGTNINKQNNKAFIEACRFGHTKIVQELLYPNTANPFIFMDQKTINTGATMAIQNNYESILKILTEYATAKNMSPPEPKYSHIFINSVSAGNVDVVKSAITRINVCGTPDNDRRDSWDDWRVSLRRNLFEACRRGHIEVLKVLLNVSDSRVEGVSPQHTRVEPGSPQHTRVEPGSPQHTRVEPGSNLDNDPENPDGVDDDNYNNSYLIIEAASFGHLDIVEFLLKRPDVAPGVRGNAAIYFACRYGHRDIVKTLLYSTTQYDMVNPTALHARAFSYACRNDHVEIVEILLEWSKTAKLDLQKKVAHWCGRGLMIAVNINSIEMVRLLLSYPGDFDLNKTREAAIKHGYADIAMLLSQ